MLLTSDTMSTCVNNDNNQRGARTGWGEGGGGSTEKSGWERCTSVNQKIFCQRERPAARQDTWPPVVRLCWRP
jgi:hypothetical protein